MPSEVIYREISKERKRQDERWGGPKHDDSHYPFDWFRFIRSQIERAWARSEDPRQVWIKIAALAVAAIESYDRRQNV